MSDFHTDYVVRRARKAHSCFECGHLIPAGDSYVVSEGMYCGDFYRIRAHRDCDEARRHVQAEMSPYWCQEEWYGLRDELRSNLNEEEVRGLIGDWSEVFRRVMSDPEPSPVE